MQRFRFTMIAICLILSWLAYADITQFGRNMSPKDMTIKAIESDGPQREWLHITEGYVNLTEAINMSGTMELNSFLVPLKSSPQEQQAKVWFETRDPALIDALKTYYFQLDTEEQRSRFRAQNQELFLGQREVTGLITSGLIANSNRDKLIQLLTDMHIAVQPDVIFISEGKEPVKWRGFIFAFIALAGVMKITRDIKTEPKKTRTP